VVKIQSTHLVAAARAVPLAVLAGTRGTWGSSNSGASFSAAAASPFSGMTSFS